MEEFIRRTCYANFNKKFIKAFNNLEVKRKITKISDENYVKVVFKEIVDSYLHFEMWNFFQKVGLTVRGGKKQFRDTFK